MNTSITSVGSTVPIGFRSFAAAVEEDDTTTNRLQQGEISFAEAAQA